MWIKEQESIFCSEFTAKSFYLSTLPSKAWFRRQHLTGDTTFCTAVLNTGAGKTLHSPPPLLWQSQISFQDKPSPPPGIPETSVSASIGHKSSTSPRDNRPHLQQQLLSSCTNSWCCSLGILNPAHYSDYFMALLLWPSLPLPALEEATCLMLSGKFWDRPVYSGGKYPVLLCV